MPSQALSAQVIARVVAWHNRHPLAERIGAQHVHSVGVVSVPFAVSGARIEPLPEPAPEAATPGPGGDTPAAEADPAPPPAAGRLPAPLRLARPVSLPPRPSRWSPRQWWAHWRDRESFRPLFTEDFIAPLRRGRVARWVARHGSPHWPLEPDAPMRLVVLDEVRRRAGDAAAELDLHVATAAVEIGGQRRRLLLAPGPHGAVIGPRAWNRPRLAAAAGSALAIVALLAAFVVELRAGVAAGPVLASAPAASAAAPATATEAASAARAGDLAPPPGPWASAPRPPDVEPRPGRIELPPLVPRLADAERSAARQAAQGVRSAASDAAHARAWALVTRPLSDRRQSERIAAQLHAVALLQPVPMRAELMSAGGGWRAVFWPFRSAQDAEKARLALAYKGLRTEVVEF